MQYEEKEATLDAGESLILYSDGLIEAHNPEGEMYGFPRLKQFVVDHGGEGNMINLVVEDLALFVRPGWEQEDDVTIVMIEREAITAQHTNHSDTRWHTLDEFEVASEPGNERQVMDRVTEIVQQLGITGTRLERIRTASAEAAMNAMEHGNRYQSEIPVVVRVYASEDDLMIKITDLGGGKEFPEAVKPDIDAKLAGLQSPRGWGLFLIESMVDEMNVKTDGRHHIVELIFHIKGA
jgi:anti-sigma regulatory factor (Ser/Thr protein kinase)